jgi:hypothetical protein
METTIYEVPIETSHPDRPQIKMLYTKELITAWLDKFWLLKDAIEAQRKRPGGKTSIMYLLGDHVISYNELEGELNRLIFFLPLNLSEADIEFIFESDYYVPLYQSFVSMAKQSDYTGGTIKFVAVEKK